ncbi:MAG: neutral zinc metallopeptidase, partial [Gemmatimonadaceae bacterium]
MRWIPGRRNENLEDRRGQSGGGFGGGGGGGIKLGLGGTVVVLVLSLVFGRDFLSELDGSGVATSSEQPINGAPVASTPSEDKMVEFVNFLMNDTDSTWSQIFAANGQQYVDPHLVLFRDAAQSACGFAQSATGPFYCPGDQKVYIDLGFFDELSSRKFGAPGEFARAYVLAHEFGHHVQNLLGTERAMRRAQQQNPQSANALSVAMELQADCFAGIWAASANKRNIIEPGDIEGGLTAAAAVGDDRLQKMGTGHVNPESFTHGSSAQRMQWFQRGYTQGTIPACDTFNR